jgi:diguanylate cyclase (GGDEF)-like protein
MIPNFPKPSSQPIVPPWQRNLLAVLRWATEPAGVPSEPERRRRYVLAWMLITLILLVSVALAMVFVFDTVNYARRNDYGYLILGLLLCLCLAFVLNRRGHYTAAARLTIACAFLGPWSSLLLDPTIIRGDFVPLTYTVLSVLLSSILLSAQTTLILAFIQVIILLYLPRFIPATAAVDWPSFIAFVFFTSMLGVISNHINRQNLNQIDQQTRQLRESEAQLRELSVRDPLTTLFNRRYMEETLDRELRRAERKQLPLGIIMIDLDHFKYFNDTYGHAAGDELLRQAGSALRACLRGYDIACRYGGEEFILLLPEASQEATLERAEQLRNDIKQLSFYAESQVFEPVTLSLGVAVYPDHGANREAILAAADSAMYRAKREGRDRVAIANKV